VARIRTLKIGFFKNEQLAELSMAHRLLFAGLWLLADREGRLEDRPRRIKGELFPYDDVDVSTMLQDLSSGPDPLVVRYVVDGRGYLVVRKFTEHQRPHYSEPQSSHPPPNQTFTETAENSAATAEIVVTPTLGREGKGRERNGTEGETPARLNTAQIVALERTNTAPGGGHLKPIRPDRSGLVGYHHNCPQGTWDACARGFCVPPFVAAEWRQSALAAELDPESEIRACVAAALGENPGVLAGDKPKFWRGAWARRHGDAAQAMSGSGFKTKTERSLESASRVMAMLDKAGS
jgi:hypothetical protein